MKHDELRKKLIDNDGRLDCFTTEEQTILHQDPACQEIIEIQQALWADVRQNYKVKAPSTFSFNVMEKIRAEEQTESVFVKLFALFSRPLPAFAAGMAVLLLAVAIFMQVSPAPNNNIAVVDKNVKSECFAINQVAVNEGQLLEVAEGQNLSFLHQGQPAATVKILAATCLEVKKHNIMLRTGQIDVDMFAKGVTTLVAETSGAIVTIHGTRYILSCEKTSGQTVVEVKSGKVQVDTLMGEQHFLKAGMKITVDAAGTLLADNCKKVKEISQAVNVVKEKTLEVCLTKEPKTSGEVAVTQKPTVNLEKPVVENPKNTTSVSVAPLTAPSIIEMPVETTKDTQETKVEVKSVETLMDRLKNGNIR